MTRFVPFKGLLMYCAMVAAFAVSINASKLQFAAI